MNLGYPQRVEVSSVIFAASGRFHDQYSRPYDPIITDSDSREIQNLFNKRTTINTRDLIHAAPDSGAIATRHHEKLLIPNGWGTERYIWIITGDIVYDDGTRKFFKMRGYTEQDEVINRRDSYSDRSSRNRDIVGNRIDPRAVMYITAYVEYAETSDNADRFMGYAYRDGGLIIKPQAFTDRHDIVDSAVYRIEPGAALARLNPVARDIARYSNGSVRAKSQRDLDNEWGDEYDDDRPIDTNPITSLEESLSVPVIVKPGTVNHHDALAKAVNAIAKASESNAYGNDSPYSAAYSEYAPNALDSASSMAFIKIIMKNNDYEVGRMQSDCFLWSDLVRYDPDLAKSTDRVTCLADDSRMRSEAPDCTGCYWDDSDNPVLTSIAQNIATMLVTYMITANIASIGFMCENFGYEIEPTFTPTKAAVLNHTRPTRDQKIRAERFIENRFVDTIWPVITKDQLRASVDITAIEGLLISIKMTVDGVGSGEWTMPAFNIGSFVGIATTSEHHQSSVLGSIETLLEDVGESLIGVSYSNDSGGPGYKYDLHSAFGNNEPRSRREESRSPLDDTMNSKYGRRKERRDDHDDPGSIEIDINEIFK